MLRVPTLLVAGVVTPDHVQPSLAPIAPKGGVSNLRERPDGTVFGAAIEGTECATRRLKEYMERSHSIFVHIPKTGGTTVEQTFGITVSCHATADQFRSVDLATWDVAHTFAVIRHPLERLISHYEYTKAGGDASPPWCTRSAR